MEPITRCALAECDETLTNDTAVVRVVIGGGGAEETFNRLNTLVGFCSFDCFAEAVDTWRLPPPRTEDPIVPITPTEAPVTSTVFTQADLDRALGIVREAYAAVTQPRLQPAVLPQIETENTTWHNHEILNPPLARTDTVLWPNLDNRVVRYNTARTLPRNYLRAPVANAVMPVQAQDNDEDNIWLRSVHRYHHLVETILSTNVVVAAFRLLDVRCTVNDRINNGQFRSSRRPPLFAEQEGFDLVMRLMDDNMRTDLGRRDRLLDRARNEADDRTPNGVHCGGMYKRITCTGLDLAINVTGSTLFLQRTLVGRGFNLEGFPEWRMVASKLVLNNCRRWLDAVRLIEETVNAPGNEINEVLTTWAERIKPVLQLELNPTTIQEAN